MRVNVDIALVGERALLVPYRKEHVQKYHEWMSDSELRELTASEPLTLEEEFDMQKQWQEDEDKLTFIIFARDYTYHGEGVDVDVCDTARMVGDVNLFFKGSPNDDDYEVEAEVMIAEKAYRRKGYASESLQLLLSFATTFYYPPLLPVADNKFVVRIGEDNSSSIALFKKLGFKITKYVGVFRELEMRMDTVEKKERLVPKIVKLS